MTPSCQITQNGGLAVTNCRPNLKLPYRLRCTHSAQNCVPAPAGTPHIRLQNRIGVFLLLRVPLRYALADSANEYQWQRKEEHGVSCLCPGI